MKVLFINALLGGDFSALDISITNLATYLNERTKHQAAILDLTFHTKHWKSYLHTNLKKEKPDIIAMSTNTMYMQYVKRIAKEIKEHHDLPIIVGGYHASQYPEDTINLQDIDALCIGDGEYVLTEFLNNYEKGLSAKGMKGIWAKERGNIIRNQRGCFIKDIDSLPIPNWDLWKDLKKYFYYLGMLYIIGTRGCPYKCTYCDAHGISNSVDGNYFRIRDPVKYAQEIAYQWKKYSGKGMRLAQLFDQVLTINEDWLKKFSEEYRKQLDVKTQRYSAFSRIDNLDEDKIKLLGKSGCALLRVGIEAGDSYIRNEVYKKRISNENIRKITKLCKENGIGLTAFYILGGPGENRRTVNETINMARKLDAERSAFFVFKPFTEASRKQIIEFGGTIDERRWGAADNITFDAVVKLKNLSPRSVEFLQKKAYFYTFGKRLLHMVGRKKLGYFSEFSTYMTRGLKDGLDWHYLLPYYHIYGYDNVDR